MQMNQLKQGIDRVEQCADEAKQQLQAGSAPAELKECIDTMHQQARQVQQAASSQQQQMGQDVRDQVVQLEQTADRAMQACRKAGSSVTPQQQQAVQRAHQEASSLKKQVQMG